MQSPAWHHPKAPKHAKGKKWSDRRNGNQLTTSSQQRNLNNAFAYDLVPSPQVVAAALKAARRVNDFATAIRIFEGMTRPTPTVPLAASQTYADTYHNRHQVQG